MLTEDLKILAEECGFHFYTQYDKAGVEADEWQAVSTFANLLVNRLIQKTLDGPNSVAALELKMFLKFKLGDDLRKYGINVD